MEDQTEKKSRKNLIEWLNNLQQESWQLELVISGFAIFLLMGVYEPLGDLRNVLARTMASTDGNIYLVIPYLVLQGAWFVLFVNLLIHVLFRGLWISTIGLRYVSGDIDYEQLRLSNRFSRFLGRRIGNFDRYIERLERLCSIIFAFTFLIVFMLLSLGLYGAFVLVVLDSITDFIKNNLGVFGEVLALIIIIFMLLATFLYFLDFITLGWVKRKRWLSRFYFPIYRFMGWVTLANFYRPLYYNLIDNKFGRWVGFLLVPYVLFAAVASSLNIQGFQYFPKKERNNPAFLNTRVYEDQRDDESWYSWPTIPSKYISNGYVELFIPYVAQKVDKQIEFVCEGLTPAHHKGLRLEGLISTNIQALEYDVDSLLQCMSQVYQIVIDDSVHQDLRFHFTAKEDLQQPGLITLIDVSEYERGEHLLKLSLLDTNEKSDTTTMPDYEIQAYIPFWIK